MVRCRLFAHELIISFFYFIKSEKERKKEKQFFFFFFILVLFSHFDLQFVVIDTCVVGVVCARSWWCVGATADLSLGHRANLDLSHREGGINILHLFYNRLINNQKVSYRRARSAECSVVHAAQWVDGAFEITLAARDLPHLESLRYIWFLCFVSVFFCLCFSQYLR